MPAFSPAELKAQQRNLLYLSQPQRWPLWPILPLVRRKQGQEEEYGLLYDLKTTCGLLGYSSTVWLCNLFFLPPTLDQFLALPHETYDKPEEIAEAGWTID